MLVTVQYFEGNRYVGSQQVERSWRPGQWITESRYWPNTVYFCGDCGDIWAREVTQAKHYLPQSWALVHRRCVKHGNGELLTGLIDLEGCDKELLTRELLALIEGA